MPSSWVVSLNIDLSHRSISELRSMKASFGLMKDLVSMEEYTIWFLLLHTQFVELESLLFLFLQFFSISSWRSTIVLLSQSIFSCIKFWILLWDDALILRSFSLFFPASICMSFSSIVFARERFFSFKFEILLTAALLSSYIWPSKISILHCKESLCFFISETHCSCSSFNQ